VDFDTEAVGWPSGRCSRHPRILPPMYAKTSTNDVEMYHLQPLCLVSGEGD
jgi:hypothetical protein